MSLISESAMYSRWSFRYSDKLSREKNNSPKTVVFREDDAPQSLRTRFSGAYAGRNVMVCDIALTALEIKPYMRQCALYESRILVAGVNMFISA